MANFKVRSINESDFTKKKKSSTNRLKKIVFDPIDKLLSSDDSIIRGTSIYRIVIERDEEKCIMRG